MNKLHTLVVAGLLALAAVLGTVAATRTVTLGASAQQTNAAAVQAKVRQLETYAASLRRAHGTQRVVYHRPPPIVVVRHHHGDDGFEGPDD
jgi:hypothetical protein